MKKTEVRQSALLSRKKKVLFVAVMLISSFVILEIGARVIFAFEMGPRALLYGTSYFRNTAEERNKIGAGNVGSESGGYSKYFPNEFKIDHDNETGESFLVSINRQGFRGKDFNISKEPGVVRVITLGASSTFGFFDRDDETYPYYLEQELEQRTRDMSFEVINLGIPHLTTDQIRALFLAEALPLDPDVVTFYEGINDSSQMPDKVWMEKKQEPPKTASQKLRKSAASLPYLRSIYTALRNRLITISLIDSVLADTITYNHIDYEEHINGKSKRFLGNVSAIRDSCRKRGIIFIVLKQQARSMMIADVKGLTYEGEIKLVREKLDRTDSITHKEKAFLTHKIITDDLQSWARTEGLPFVDVVELLDQDRDVLLSWVHLSPRGNRIIARALAQEIINQLCVPPGCTPIVSHPL